MKLSHLLLSAALVSVACNNGDDTDDTDDTDASSSEFAGLYLTDSEAESETCTDWEELGFPVPYFKLDTYVDGLGLYICRTPDDCDEFTEYDAVITQKDSGKWVGVETWAFPNEGDGTQEICGFNARRITLETTNQEGRIRVMVEQAEDAIAVNSASEELCDEEVQDWNPSFAGGLFNCRRIVGDLVE